MRLDALYMEIDLLIGRPQGFCLSRETLSYVFLRPSRETLTSFFSLRAKLQVIVFNYVFRHLGR